MMTTYIALLRGINVGGNRIIKMAELKNVLEALGLKDAKTYIQSGNVLFRSDDDAFNIQDKIEKEINRVWGFDVPVVLRSAKELEQLINNCPFSDEEIKTAEQASGKESLYISFMANVPSPEKIQSLKPYENENESYHVIGREVFLLFRDSIRNSKVANNLHRLDAHSTVRNSKTVKKLLALAMEMEASKVRTVNVLGTNDI